MSDFWQGFWFGATVAVCVMAVLVVAHSTGVEVGAKMERAKIESRMESTAP